MYKYTHQALGVLLLSLSVSSVSAEPRFAQMYKQQAGYMPSCNACHVDGGGSDLNVYGELFKENGATMASFVALAEQDADEDSHSNSQEMAAKANPGNKKSTPAKPGDWLDTANLIPRDVQKLFPGVTRYKPLDALLTDKDIERAAQMGVALAKQDETTIYIPIESGKPAGTAIIVPVTFQQQQFFVILVTDRQLKVSQAVPMHAKAVPAVEQSTAFSQVKGLAVDNLPAGDGEDLDSAILNGLKKAGSLLYVRLKGQ
ncbi:MAG: hypothetical protein ACSHXK_04220 [Oceanococcus sp.]